MHTSFPQNNLSNSAGAPAGAPSQASQRAAGKTKLPGLTREKAIEMMGVSLDAIREARNDLIKQRYSSRSIAAQQEHHLRHRELCRDLLAQLNVKDRLKVLADFETNPDPLLFPFREWHIRICRDEIVCLTIGKEQPSPFMDNEAWLPSITNECSEPDEIEGPALPFPSQKAAEMISHSFCSLLTVESNEEESHATKDNHRKLHLQICEYSLALVAAKDRWNTYRLKLAPANDIRPEAKDAQQALLDWHHFHCVTIMEKLACEDRGELLSKTRPLVAELRRLRTQWPWSRGIQAEIDRVSKEIASIEGQYGCQVSVMRDMDSISVYLLEDPELEKRFCILRDDYLEAKQFLYPWSRTSQKKLDAAEDCILSLLEAHPHHEKLHKKAFLSISLSGLLAFQSQHVQAMRKLRDDYLELAYHRPWTKALQVKIVKAKSRLDRYELKERIFYSMRYPSSFALARSEDEKVENDFLVLLDAYDCAQTSEERKSVYNRLKNFAAEHRLQDARLPLF